MVTGLASVRAERAALLVRIKELLADWEKAQRMLPRAPRNRRKPVDAAQGSPISQPPP